jgi:circadian clock protein KaiC
VEISYLADAVLALRYFETNGAVRRAAAVIKRRCGAHEFAIRDMEILRGGVRIGGALVGIRDILSGHPEFVGTPPAREAPADRAGGRPPA